MNIVHHVRFMRFSSSGNDMPLLYDAQVQLAMAIMLPLLILILGKSRVFFNFYRNIRVIVRMCKSKPCEEFH